MGITSLLAPLLAIVFLGLTAMSLLSPYENLSSSGTGSVLPGWVKYTAKWYVDGLISDEEFANAMKFLENQLIIGGGRLSAGVDTHPYVHQNASTTVITIPNSAIGEEKLKTLQPVNVIVSKGSTVEWINQDSMWHRVQSQDASGAFTGTFKSGQIETGESFQYTFIQPGVYRYSCPTHPWRAGTIIVR